MKNTKKLKVMKKMKEICSVVAGTVTGCLFPVKQVSAADSVVSGVNNLTSLVTTIIAAVGTVVLAQGIWDFASAYRSHDSGTQTQACLLYTSWIFGRKFKCMRITANSLVTLRMIYIQ